MNTPFYKKRPQWWVKLLEIFQINEKQYWLCLLCCLGGLLITFLILYIEYLQGYHSLTPFIFQYATFCSFTGPFGYYWTQKQLQKLHNDWFKLMLIHNYGVVAVILSPIILIAVLLKYYFTK